MRYLSGKRKISCVPHFTLGSPILKFVRIYLTRDVQGSVERDEIDKMDE